MSDILKCICGKEFYDSACFASHVRKCGVLEIKQEENIMKLQNETRQLQSELEAERAEKRELREAAAPLVDLYLANKDTEHEFVVCVTPPREGETHNQWKRLKKALSNTTAPTEAEIRADQMRKDAYYAKSQHYDWYGECGAAACIHIANELRQQAGGSDE